MKYILYTYYTDNDCVVFLVINGIVDRKYTRFVCIKFRISLSLRLRNIADGQMYVILWLISSKRELWRQSLGNAHTQQQRNCQDMRSDAHRRCYGARFCGDESTQQWKCFITLSTCYTFLPFDTPQLAALLTRHIVHCLQWINFVLSVSIYSYFDIILKYLS